MSLPLEAMPRILSVPKGERDRGREGERAGGMMSPMVLLFYLISIYFIFIICQKR